MMSWTCEQAISEAKRRASDTGLAQTVWRCNERFGVSAETSGCPVHSMTINNPCPIRPVATYDSDGTEHS